MKPWREEDHPRDEIGRFTEKDDLFFPQNTPYAEILRRERELHRLPLDYFGQKDPPSRLTKSDIPRVVYGFSKTVHFNRLKTKRHITHAADMGKTSKDYNMAAIAFWESGVGTLYACDKDRAFYQYDTASGKLLVVTADGTIRTFFSIDPKLFAKYIIQKNLREM